MSKIEKWIIRCIRKYHLTIPIATLVGVAMIWVGIQMQEMSYALKLLLELIK